jgi:hypothetical protein
MFGERLVLTDKDRYVLVAGLKIPYRTINNLSSLL